MNKLCCLKEVWTPELPGRNRNQPNSPEEININQVSWKNQRLAKMPREGSVWPGHWKGTLSLWYAASRLFSELQISGQVSCHPRWDGPWWCSRLPVISAPLSSPDKTHHQLTKLTHNFDLVQHNRNWGFKLIKSLPSWLMMKRKLKANPDFWSRLCPGRAVCSIFCRCKDHWILPQEERDSKWSLGTHLLCTSPAMYLAN